VPRVLVCGDVINDVLAETPAALAYGQDNPAVIRMRPGGSAANQAAWLGSLGVDVVFAGRAGAADAEFHRRELAGFGVEAHIAADESVATGTIVVLVGPDGERTMVTDRGANLRLRREDVPASLLNDAVLLHLTGYSFVVPQVRQVVREIEGEARGRAVPWTIDPGSAGFLAALEPGEFLEWTRGAAVCFPNRDEAAVLAGTADPLAAAAFLCEYYGAVVVKLGADGALCATADESWRGDGMPWTDGGVARARVAARPAGVRDTTGAGDAFCAGFLAAWIRGAPLLAATEAGAELAALAVCVPGGRPVTS
jgi:sugar/nucleoside kinase (ribokinase family)